MSRTPAVPMHDAATAESGRRRMKEVATFSISHTGIIDADGKATGELPAFARDAAELIRLYRTMVLTRSFDARAIALQRTGRLGTYGSSLGQEAAAVGVGAAMRPDDVLLPSFRETGAQLLRGVSLRELFLYWGGDERGSDFQAAREDFPICVPVGSQAPHAAGVALAFKLRQQPRVAVCVFGDGTTSKGDVAEAANIAGAWNLPVVFVVVNNGWAISVPRDAQSAAGTLAQKAIAAGMPGMQVDGNDVVAVRVVVGEAIERARRGEGPGWIEALTYRLADHTTADDASRYRDPAEVTAAWKADPIARLRTWLVASGAWGRQQEQDLLQACTAEVDAAAAAYLETPPQAPETVFDYLYAMLPAALAEQRARFLAEALRHG